MDLGVITTVFVNQPLDVALDECQRLGLHYVEIGTGGYLGQDHCNPERLLADPTALDGFRKSLERHELRISAFAIHGEPLHPDASVATSYDQQFRATVALAKQLNVERLTLLAGLPGASAADANPNWVVYPWPHRNVANLEWQWTERLIPYWRDHGRIAEEAGVRLCFELHPADLVFQPSGLLRLRDSVGPVVGANLDPSHLIWQGIDIRVAVKALGPAIYHVHAKDSRLNADVVRKDGVLDTKPWRLEADRAWLFRTVGYGNDDIWWRDFLSALRMAGYDDVLSIEHEDPLLDPLEGLEHAVQFLRSMLPTKPRAGLWFD